jgi:light-regulated signal transduction histidine kinase (bacteriophytochrome)
MKRAGRAGERTQARKPGTEVGASRSPERLEAEIARLSARVEELESERARLQDFAAMAAHELLKPLVMNEAYATLIGERVGHSLDHESRRDLEAIVRISSRVRMLVEALLLDAHDTGRPLRRERVDLADVMRDCVRMLDAEIKTREAKVDIDPMPVVEGDPALLSGVFGNLLANALKYGPRRGSDIKVTVVRSEAGWTFAVQSPGPAIPAEGAERIFEAWERGPGERRARGAGLGLAIVRHIVERHGGEVGVASNGESRNRFFFTLPA